MKSCPLGEVEAVGIDSGIVRIRRKGKNFAFASVFVSSIPNVFLFLRLLQSLLPGERAQPARASVG